MGKIKINEAENYKSGSSAGFFNLKDDHDTAVVRFMYNDIDDVDIDVVHEIEVDGKSRNVNCLRSYDDPIDDCPLCKAGYRQKLKMFVPVFNVDAGEVQMWQRGKTFATQLSGLCNRYKPLVGTLIEIERQGKKGDQQTRYQMYPQKSDNTTLEDLPEVPSPVGTIIMDKSYDELSYFVENGAFRGENVSTRDTQHTEVVKRRRSF